MADRDGVVSEVTDHLLTVSYKDNTIETYPIGEQLTSYEGVTYLNILKTTLKKGDKFKAGDCLYYHDSFFEPDWLNPKHIVAKMNRYYTVAFMSNDETYEDSSAVSKRVMKEMVTTVLKELVFIIDFETNINNVVKVGEELTPNTTLYIDTGNNPEGSNLSDASLSMLDTLNSQSPRAQFKGTLNRIEMSYNGEISDMSPTLAKIARSLDKERFERSRGTSYEAKNNKVSGEYSSGGKKLNINQLELRFYIEVVLEMETGDKLAFANQAKSVVSEVMDFEIVGETSGDIVDGQYATVSAIYRVINSPFVMGIGARLFRLRGVDIAKAYFGIK